MAVLQTAVISNRRTGRSRGGWADGRDGQPALRAEVVAVNQTAALSSPGTGRSRGGLWAAVISGTGRSRGGRTDGRDGQSRAGRSRGGRTDGRDRQSRKRPKPRWVRGWRIGSGSGLMRAAGVAAVAAAGVAEWVSPWRLRRPRPSPTGRSRGDRGGGGSVGLGLEAGCRSRGGCEGGGLDGAVGKLAVGLGLDAGGRSRGGCGGGGLYFRLAFSSRSESWWRRGRRSCSGLMQPAKVLVAGGAGGLAITQRTTSSRRDRMVS